MFVLFLKILLKLLKILGIIALILLGVLLVIGLFMPEEKLMEQDGPATYFVTPRECVGDYGFKVVEIIDDKYVIAQELVSESEDDTTDLVVVFVDTDKHLHYDNQKIIIPVDQCAKQIGVYKPTNNKYRGKKLPIVKIKDK